jgi:hypothetical protein
MIKKILSLVLLFLSQFLTSIQIKTFSSEMEVSKNTLIAHFPKLSTFFLGKRLNLFSVKTIVVTFFLFFVSLASATTITTTGSGNWNSTIPNAPWPGGIVPLATDNVIISSGRTVTLITNSTITNLTLSATTSKLVINNGQILTVSGVFLNSGTTTNGVNGPGTILFTGTTTFGILTPTGVQPNVVVGDGLSTNTVTVGGNPLIFNLTVNIGSTLNTNTRTLTVNGTLRNNGVIIGTTSIFNLIGDFNNTGNFAFSGAGRLSLSGNYINTRTVSLFSARVQFTGTANQTIQGFTTTGVVNMLKTGGIATFTGNVSGGGLTINGIGGTLNLGTELIHTFSGTWTRTNGVLDGGSSLLKIGGSVTGTGGTFTPGLGTVEYNRVGAQTAAVVTYNNLTLSGTLIKTFSTTPTINGIFSLEGTATVTVTTGVVTYGINATLKYNTATPRNASSEEWISPFASTGGVIIANTGTITMNAVKVFNTSIPLTINSGAKLSMTTFLLILKGDLVNNGGTATGTTGGVVISGTAAQNIGAFVTTGVISMTKTAGVATFKGAVNGFGLTINGIGGTLNLGTGLQHTFSGVVTLANGILNGGLSTLNVNATSTTAWNGTGTNFIASGGTVKFGGGNQTLVATSTFNNLTFSNSGVKTLTGLPTINGILSMEGTATVSTVPNYGTSATLQYNRTANQVVGPEWKTPFTAAGGVNIISTGIITLDGIKSFGTTTPLAIFSGATLDNGGFAISGGAIFTVENTATLKITGTSTFPVFAITLLGTSSLIEYAGIDQIVATENYGNLALKGTGNKTFAGATTIAGDLGISGSAAALLYGFCSSQSLTFNNVVQTLGSWGGSISSATYTDVSKFGSTTTGVLNVDTACTTGTWLGTLSSDWNTAANWCGGVLPTAMNDIVITSASVNQPVISTNTSCGNIAIDNGATLIIVGSNTLTVRGNWINDGTFVSNNSTVNFNGVAEQIIGGVTSTVFNNLTNSNTANSVVVKVGISVTDILNISNVVSVLDMTNFSLADGGSFSNFGSGTLKTSSIAITPIPVGKTWTSSVVYNNLIGGQIIVGGNYAGSPSLNLENTSGVQTASGNISTSNRFNIDNGGAFTFNMAGFNLNTAILNLNDVGAILDMGVGSLSFTSIAAMNGIVRFSGESNGIAFGSGTVEYYGGGLQTVASGTYSNLLFSGSGGSYKIADDISVNHWLRVTDGDVNVQGSSTIAVEDAVTVVAPGSLTLENNASLVQTAFTGANVGNINVKRHSTPIILDDFTYWSSPTTGTQTLLNFSPDTQGDKFFDYNNDWANVAAATTVFSPGIGYAIRAPEGTSASVPTVETSFRFTGIPNNGTINIPVTLRVSDGFGERLVGNPYPSILDADAFIDANVLGGTGTQTISGTLYFWTHNHTLIMNNNNDYDGNDYAVYTKAGGTKVGVGTGSINVPTTDIASGQGFFVEIETPGNLTFNNDMRKSGDNSNFYKMASTKKVLEESSRIWLNLTNGSQNFSQVLVGYITNATNDYDPGYDGRVYDENQPFAIYSLINSDKMTIQGRFLPFDDTDTVPLGYTINVEGNATISIDHFDGLFEDNQNIYLEDKLIDVVYDIKESPYNFSSATGTFNDRFVLRYTDKTLGTTDFDTTNNQILVSNKNRQLTINAFDDFIDKVVIYDAAGRKIYQKRNVANKELTVLNLASGQQVLLVNVVLQNGRKIIKKIVY